MTVLLAGGAGYIGSHTAVQLLMSGHDVVIADDYSNSCPEVINRIEEITGKQVRAYETDVKDKIKVRQIFAGNEIDCVIHFAGLKAVGESVQQPLKYYRNHIDAARVHAGGRCQAVCFLVLRDGLRRGECDSVHRNDEARQLLQPIWLDQGHDGRNS